MTWYWQDKPYSLEQIATGDFVAQDEFMESAWTFAQQWLNGAMTFVLPTSGSTGKPKNITLTRAQMQASAQATAEALQLACHKTALLAINPAYVGGKMMLVRALEYGLALTGIPPARNPLATNTALFERQIYDFIALVPAQLYTVATETPDLLACLQDSKAIILGGGAVSESLLQAIQNLKAPLYNTYGMTETVSHIALKRLNDAEKSSYFTAFKNVQLATDERNCLKICGTVTQNEWIQTHDVVQLIDEKRFIWIGRADNILNTGGIKVQIEVLETKIEAILKQLNLFMSFAIVGIADAQWQQKIVLFLEINALPTDLSNALWKSLKTCLPRYEVPKEIRFLAQFPKTDTGKIKRADL